MKNCTRAGPRELGIRSWGILASYFFGGLVRTGSNTLSVFAMHTENDGVLRSGKMFFSRGQLLDCTRWGVEGGGHQEHKQDMMDGVTRLKIL